MRRELLKIVCGMIVASFALTVPLLGQSPSKTVAANSTPTSSTESSTPSASTPYIEVLPPLPAETADIVVDPASLLPDLPKLPNSKASLIGGTVGRLDRVRDQITVQVFGGGKMKVSFDPRTHIYHDGAEATLADLHQGDRVYIETILDGSSVFARAIRLKTTALAGESQGLITSYNAAKGELLLHDALSPRTVKIRVTSQTRILEGEHSASAATLAPGTLVGVKFGARNAGDQVAREVSVLATPGQSFTFAGQINSIDLRLGLIVLTSSTDHKTYEIYLDPSATIDDSIRPSVDVTVLTRFQENRYVARSITVNSPVQR